MTDTRINSKYFNAFKPLKYHFTGKSAHLQFVGWQTKPQFLVHLKGTYSSCLTMLNEIKRAK